MPVNKYLVSGLLESNVYPYSVALLVRPPSGAALATGVTFDLLTQATFSTMAQAVPTTNYKLQRILKK